MLFEWVGFWMESKTAGKDPLKRESLRVLNSATVWGASLIAKCLTA